MNPPYFWWQILSSLSTFWTVKSSSWLWVTDKWQANVKKKKKIGSRFLCQTLNWRNRDLTRAMSANQETHPLTDRHCREGPSSFYLLLICSTHADEWRAKENVAAVPFLPRQETTTMSVCVDGNIKTASFTEFPAHVQHGFCFSRSVSLPSWHVCFGFFFTRGWGEGGGRGRDIWATDLTRAVRVLGKGRVGQGTLFD